jgi:hypothetical protein
MGLQNKISTFLEKSGPDASTETLTKEIKNWTFDYLKGYKNFKQLEQQQFTQTSSTNFRTLLPSVSLF